MSLQLLTLSGILPMLAADPRLLPVDVRIYIHLFFNPLNTIRGHAKTMGLPISTVHRSISRLLKTEWAYLHGESASGKGMVAVAWMPPSHEEMIATRLQLVQHDVINKGEWYLKCILDHIVRDFDVHDNARPEWLVSGKGAGRLELDRLYRRAKVAVEFQGAQHFRRGETMNETEEKLAQQIANDNLKAAICMRNKIQLIEFTWRDLSYDKVADKLRGILPVIPVKEDGPLYTTLSRLCLSYSNYAARMEKRRTLSR